MLDQEFEEGSTMYKLIVERVFDMIWEVIEQFDEYRERRTAGGFPVPIGICE